MGGTEALGRRHGHPASSGRATLRAHGASCLFQERAYESDRASEREREGGREREGETERERERKRERAPAVVEAARPVFMEVVIVVAGASTPLHLTRVVALLVRPTPIRVSPYFN